MAVIPIEPRPISERRKMSPFLPTLADDLIRENRLKQVPGIGDAIADIIKTMHQTGSYPLLEKMRQDFPVAKIRASYTPRHSRGQNSCPSQTAWRQHA